MDLLIPWLEYIKPFKMADNLYFVGAKGGSSHVIDTGEGLIMIDSGYPQTLYQVIENMHIMGLNPMDIKYIVHSHGHYDHLGATRALVELTGAKTFLGEADYDFATGKVDLTWAKELGFEYTLPFEPDVLLKDGDEITLGNTTIKCYHTPGHTPGCNCYVIDDIMFTGDTIFAQSIGRTDFPTSDNGAMLSSLRFLKNLKEDYVLYPGHGGKTTLFTEKKFNPYMVGV